MSRESFPVRYSPQSNDPSSLQRTASDPMHSSWVGASAGSGKTKVLTDRILRLLLPREDGSLGTDPRKILALTFTKAGATEMALRLSSRLSSWVVMKDDLLAKDMEENLLGRPPEAEELTAARKLFAHVIDTPGGLNIMTIHSFCQSILGRFPLEAGVSPHFKPLEEAIAREYIAESIKSVLSEAALNPHTPLAAAVRHISRTLSETDIPSLIKNIISERNQFRTLIQKNFGLEGLYTRLCTEMDLPAGLTQEQAFAAFVFKGDEPALRSVCPALLSSKSGSDQAKADAIQKYWDADTHIRMKIFQSYVNQIVRQNGNFWPPTKDAQSKHSLLLEILQTEYERIRDYQDLQKKLSCIEATRDLFLIADAILDRYDAIKQKTGALDFDDLILKTLSLLKGDVKTMEGLKVTPWVQYKLDEGLDHILVDEAQDTNPEQWQIADLLTDDFFSGTGARDYVRTIFVVGDEKQSIFGFQRAAPDKMTNMKARFAKRIREAEETFAPVDINTSFRSVQVILDAVDAVFSYGPTMQGMGPNYLPHMAHRTGQAGLVEIWPLYRTEDTGISTGEDNDSTSETGWDIPDKIFEVQSGSARMAGKIAQTIRDWLDKKEILQSYGRPIQPGDIMVLVRSRNAFVSQLVHALKKNRVPVSGVDRMILSEQLVVQDMAAAAAFALLPDDNLTLACLLKSPFIGMDEEQLYELAHGRHTSLWNQLKKSGDTELVSWLEALITNGGRMSPYTFLSSIVHAPCPANAHSGMKAIYARLGEDALDPLDEFLNSALVFENAHTPSLQGFLHWHEQGNTEIKRELDKGAGEVRIMTVHGSKGLQAPIVFLPDTVRTQKRHDERILWPHRSDAELPVFLPSRKDAPENLAPYLARLDQKADEEYRRLLYVAMTRAEERLYIGGYMGKKKPPASGALAYWYDDIRTALEKHPDIQTIPSDINGEDGNPLMTLRLQHDQKAEPDKKTHSAQNEQATIERIPALPDWAFKTMPPEPSPPQPLVPSRPSDLEEPALLSPLENKADDRFKRGVLIHRLMQVLPDLAPERRLETARQYLAQPAHDLTKVAQDEIVTEVMRVLNDNAFKEIFGSSSMAEVPITGLIRPDRLVSGQIDRILIGENDILVIDYKTNRPPPKTRGDVPEIYVRQLQTYVDTLRAIYPKHVIRAALLWTSEARLMEIISTAPAPKQEHG